MLIGAMNDALELFDLESDFAFFAPVGVSVGLVEDLSAGCHGNHGSPFVAYRDFFRRGLGDCPASGHDQQGECKQKAWNFHRLNGGEMAPRCDPDRRD